MKVDLGVVSQSTITYDKAIPQFEENRKRLNDAITYLTEVGWSGKGQEQYKAHLEYFFEKEYVPLQKSLELLNNTLKDVVKAKGQLLKQQCEDFANCFDGTAKCFFTGEGYAQGILSLEYDNVNPMINIYNEIASETTGMFTCGSDDLISKKKVRLNELKNDIKRQSFLSGQLEYSHLDISNEVAEALNNIKKEQNALNEFIQSLKAYSSGLKNLEYNTQRGLNEIETVGKMVVMTGGQKAVQVGIKTVTNDIVGGTATALTGGALVASGIAGEGETAGISTANIVVGSCMVVSGTNTAVNGFIDLKYEWNYEWSEVGQHNAGVNFFSYIASKSTGNENLGNKIGNGIILGTDVVASLKSGKDMKENIISDLKNVKGMTNVNNTWTGVKSCDNIVRGYAIGNWYNYVTVKGDLASTKDAFGFTSSDSNIDSNIDYGNSKMTITSIYPNNVTIFNDGNPQLIK